MRKRAVLGPWPWGCWQAQAVGRAVLDTCARAVFCEPCPCALADTSAVVNARARAAEGREAAGCFMTSPTGASSQALPAHHARPLLMQNAGRGGA